MGTEWSTAIHATQSGELLEVIKPAAGGWVRGQVSSRQHLLRLADDGLNRTRRHEVFQEWDRTLVVRDNGVPVYAGLITGLPYAKASQLLTVKHIDLRELLKRRHLFGVPFYEAAGKVDVEGLSLGGVIRRMLYLGLVHPFSEWWPVPVNLPAEEAGSISRTFFHYDFQTIDKILTDITKEDGAPDFDLQPVYDADERLSWDALIGSPYLAGPTFDVPLDADESPATDLAVGRDGMRMATGVFVQGKGGEQDMRVAQVVDDIPGLSKDWELPAKKVDDLDQLASLGRGYLKPRARPTRQWSLSVQAADVPPHLLRLGSTIRTHIHDDPWLPDGAETHRVIGFSGDVSSETITLELEEQ